MGGIQTPPMQCSYGMTKTHSTDVSS